jgi:hypothetical protein
VLLHLVGDVGGKDGLQPLRRTTATNPRMGGGHRASKAGGELRGTQGKAFVPSHGEILPAKKKNAMRKIILITSYALRKVFACPTPNNTPPSKTTTAPNTASPPTWSSQHGSSASPAAFSPLRFLLTPSVSWKRKRLNPPKLAAGWRESNLIRLAERASSAVPTDVGRPDLHSLHNEEAWHPLPGAPLRIRLGFVATLRIQLGTGSGLSRAGLLSYLVPPVWGNGCYWHSRHDPR